MKISTRGRYALRFLVDIAQHSEEGFVALKDVAKRQEISRKYLEQIIPFLNRGNFLLSNKGHGGGYKLAKSPLEITARDVLECAEGSLAPVSCMDNQPNQCDRSKICKTLPIYQGLYEIVVQYLDSITLQDIVDGKIDHFEIRKISD